MSRTRKPRKWSVGPIRVRPVRGPKGERWYWRAEIHRDGQSTTVWTGWGTRHEAERTLGEMLAKGVELSIDRTHPEERISSVCNLMEAYVAHMESRKDIAANTKSIARTSGKHIVRHIGDIQLSRLTMRELESFRDRRLHEGAATQTTYNDMAILRRAWNWARKHAICPDHSLPNPSLEVVATRDKYTPSRAELWSVLDALEGWPRLMVEILGNTGARVGEAALLRWENIDFKEGKVRIKQPKKRKQAPYRYMPLTESLETSLREWGVGRNGSRILPVSFDTARTSITQRWLKPTCQELGLRYFTPHGIRRLVIDELLEVGIDPATVAKMMGHSEKVMMEHYRQARFSDMQRAVKLAALGKRKNPTLLKLDEQLRQNA